MKAPDHTTDAPRAAVSGVVFAVLSAASFATSGSFAKSLLDVGWSPGAAVTIRIAIAGLILAVPSLLMMRGRWRELRRAAPMIVIYGMLAVAGCQLFFFNAVQTLSVGVALLLEYLGLVLVVGWVWLREKQTPGGWTILGVVLSILGLVLVLDVFGGFEIDVTGVLWGLGAAVGLATFFVLSAKDDSGVPPIAMAGGGMVVGAVTLAAAGALGAMPMEWTYRQVDLAGANVPWWVPVIGLSAIAGAFAYASGIIGARHLGSKLAAFLGLTEVLFAIVFAWLLLDQLPKPVQLLGGVLILGGVAAVRYESAAEAELPGVDPVPSVEFDLTDAGADGVS